MGTASTNKEICDKYDRHWIIYREEVDIHKAWLECLDDPNCDEAELFPGYESQIPSTGSILIMPPPYGTTT